MDPQDGSSGPVKVISRSEEYKSKRRCLMIFIFFSFLLTRYAILSADLVLNLVEIIQVSRTKDYLCILCKPFDSPWSSIFLDWVMLPPSFFVSSLFTLMLVYTAEMIVKEPEITLKNLTMEIFKKLKNVGAAAKHFVCFLSLGYLSLSLSLALAVLLFGSFGMGFYFLASLKTISSLVLLVSFDFILLQRVLEFIMETGCKGLASMGKSPSVVDEKRELPLRVRYRLTILAGIIAICNLLAMYKLLGKTSPYLPSPAIWNSCWMGAFGHAVHELFYLEWRSERVEEPGMEETPLYSRVPAAASSTEDIP